MNGSTIALIILLVIIVSIISPLLFIWSLNTLFGLKIAYGFFEWLAALILGGMITGNGMKFKKDS